MSGTISTLGVGSGIDLQGMLEQLREIDQQVVTDKENKITRLESQLAQFTSVTNKLFSLKSPALDLSLESTYLERTVSSSDEDVATATVISGTTPQSASLDVTQLASSSSWLLGSGADSAVDVIYGDAISQTSTEFDDTDTSVALYNGGSLTVTYGPTASPTASFTVNAAADMTLDELVTAINGDAANVEDGGLGVSLNGRLVTASVGTTEEGNKYLQIKSDYAAAADEAHKVAVSVTDADPDAALSFTDSVKEMTFQLGANSATDTALSLGKTFDIEYGDVAPTTISIDAAEFATHDVDVSGDLSFEELAEAINNDAANVGAGANGKLVWATVEEDASGNSYLQVVSDSGGSSRAEKVSITTSDSILSVDSSSVTMQTVSNISNSFSIDVTAGSSLTSLASLINDATDNLGVTATVVDDGSLTNSFYLSIVADGVGEQNRIIFPAGQGYFDDLPMDEKQGDGTSLNAQFVLNGINYQRESNAFSDVLTGVSLTLNNVGTATITVSNSDDEIKETIKEMVTAYNDVVQDVKAQTGYDLETEEFGILARTSLRDLPFTLRSLMTTSIKGSSDFISVEVVDGVTTKKDSNVYTLFDLGLEFNRDGTISLDEEVLDEVMSERPDEVKAFFLGDSDRDIEGFADKVNEQIRYLTGTEGQIAGEENSANARIRDLEDKIEQENDRLDKKYELMTKQFIELDRYMNQMTSLSSYLATQFDSISDAWGGVSKK